MLTYEILKEKATPTNYGVPNSNLPVPFPRPREFNHGVRKHWDKMRYAEWLEREVKPKFATKDLVTLATAAYIPGNVPVWIMQITFINEIHYMSALDELTDQPKAIGVKPYNQSIYIEPVCYPPCRLRKLNTEELELVRLRDQSSKDEGGSPIVDAFGQPIETNDGYSG